MREHTGMIRTVSYIESQIISTLVLNILHQGYDIQVWNEEELEVPASHDPQAIFAGIGHTGQTTLKVCPGEAAPIPGMILGWVLLVHGNEHDVISDYSDNLLTRELLIPAERVVANYAA